jgi:predicted DsbA family dithiol-disulfide isomerase
VLRNPWLPRLLLGAGAIGLLAAIISISVGTGGPKVIKVSGGDQTQRLIGGIEQDGPYLGAAEAPVTIQVFTDLQCSTCDDYQLDVVDPLIERYARTDKARFEFRNYSLGQAETTKAAYAAAAAGEQDREWQYVDLFFRNQGSAPGGVVTDEFLTDIGNAVSSISDFDIDRWRADRDSEAVKARVESDGKLAADYGLRVNGPSVIVDGPAGPTRVLQDGPSAGDVEAAIASVE